MDNQTKKKQRNLFDLSEVEEFLLKYAQWYERNKGEGDVVASSNPNDPPPPPPGPVKP